MPSFASHLINLYLRLQRRKRVFADAEAMHRSILQGRRAGAPRPPFWLRVRVNERQLAGRPLFELTPSSGTVPTQTLLFLHGGAYVHELFWPHWLFVERLVRKLGLRVWVPIYPLAPENDHRVVRDYLLALYRQLLEEINPATLLIGGDSAGGGLTLALAQQARLEGLPQPKGLVLISPWLDLALEDPASAQLEAVDLVLSLEGVREAGRLYAAGAPLSDPWLSPLHGPLDGLATLLLFAGTRDLLLPDSRALARRAEEAGASLLYHEAPDMIHDWMLLPLPESAPALRTLAEFLG